MLVFKTLVLLCAWAACTYAQQGPATTPVPILKQINRQNDDGSYSYGYEAADGSFKIETKYPSGDVAGKYGYVDESGKLREISYGASSKRGFEPQGAGIMVPPPTLNDSPSNALTDGQEDDGQYREDPKIYEDPKYHGRAQSRPSSFRQYQQSVQPEPQYEPEPAYQQQTFQPQQSFRQSFQAQQPQPAFQSQPQPAFQQSYQPQQNYQPQPAQPQPSQFRSSPLYTQTSLFSQAPQQFPQDNRPVSQVYHQQPQFSYQAYTPQPSYQQSYQQSYQPQNQNYDQFSGHPAQNFDPNTGSYTINFTG